MRYLLLVFKRHKKTSRLFPVFEFCPSPIHTMLCCKICNIKPRSSVVDYNPCPQISPRDSGHSSHHVQERRQTAAPAPDSLMVHHMIKHCPPVILSSGIKKKCRRSHIKTLIQFQKLPLIQCYILMLYHILSLSAQFKGRVNHKLDLMQHLHQTLLS